MATKKLLEDVLEELDDESAAGPWQKVNGIMKVYVTSTVDEGFGFGIQSMAASDGHDVPAETSAELIVAMRNNLKEIINTRRILREIILAVNEERIALHSLEYHNNEALRNKLYMRVTRALAVSQELLEKGDNPLESDPISSE